MSYDVPKRVLPVDGETVKYVKKHKYQVEEINKLLSIKAIMTPLMIRYIYLSK